MVRNPYAVCEGIWRYRQDQPVPSGRSLFEAAAEHVAFCLERQRRNLEAHAHLGAFFTYEAMCDRPERVERQIRSLAPEIDDLKLRQRLRVKGLYNETLTNMNARQIARLTPAQIATANRVFEKHHEVLEHFGYSLMARRSRRVAGPPGIVGECDEAGPLILVPCRGLYCFECSGLVDSDVAVQRRWMD